MVVRDLLDLDELKLIQEGDMDPGTFFLGGINTGPTVTIDQRLPAGRYFIRIMAWAEANNDCTNNLLIFILEKLKTFFIVGTEFKHYLFEFFCIVYFTANINNLVKHNFLYQIQR